MLNFFPFVHAIKSFFFHLSQIKIPKDPRTILGTNTEVIGDRSFYHFDHGLEDGINMQLNSGILFTDGIIKLEVNIDGIPIFKSPPTGFWPILCRVLGVKDREPFIVSVFCGKGKPASVEEFVQPLIDDVLRLAQDGINFNGRHYTVRLERLVCDTPARSFCKCTVAHNGYGGCERCTQKGRYLKSRMTFPRIRGLVLRDNQSFRAQRDRRHHQGISPFLQIPHLDMTKDFCLDYMHLVLLGVMKRLLKDIWTMGLARSPHTFTRSQMRRMNRRLSTIRNCLPSEFERRSRSLDDLGTWKAVEFRTFLLYTGKTINSFKATHVLILKKSAIYYIHQIFFALN